MLSLTSWTREGTGINALVLVRQYFPRMSAGKATLILWDQTSFPFGGEAELRKQLRRLRNRWRRTPRGYQYYPTRKKWHFDDPGPPLQTGTLRRLDR